MSFDLDAFISYAHMDNVGLIEGHKGWVTNLHRALEIKVGQFLGKQPQIWRDASRPVMPLLQDSKDLASASPLHPLSLSTIAT